MTCQKSNRVRAPQPAGRDRRNCRREDRRRSFAARRPNAGAFCLRPDVSVKQAPASGPDPFPRSPFRHTCLSHGVEERPAVLVAIAENAL